MATLCKTTGIRNDELGTGWAFVYIKYNNVWLIISSHQKFPSQWVCGDNSFDSNLHAVAFQLHLLEKQGEWKWGEKWKNERITVIMYDTPVSNEFIRAGWLEDWTPAVAHRYRFRSTVLSQPSAQPRQNVENALQLTIYDSYNDNAPDKDTEKRVYFFSHDGEENARAIARTFRMGWDFLVWDCLLHENKKKKKT